MVISGKGDLKIRSITTEKGTFHNNRTAYSPERYNDYKFAYA